MTSYLDNWSETIRRIGEKTQQDQDAKLTAMEEALPVAIAKLGGYTHSELLVQLKEFFGGRSDPRETVLRQRYCDAVETEILRRMQH